MIPFASSYIEKSYLGFDQIRIVSELRFSILGTVVGLLDVLFVWLIVLNLLVVALYVTRDTRKRYAIWGIYHGRPTDELYSEFSKAMFLLATFLHRQFRPLVHHRVAENALIRATVLREIIVARAGLKPPTFLRSRRQLWREARNLPLTAVAATAATPAKGSLT
jgi:hypothetical protein